MWGVAGGTRRSRMWRVHVYEKIVWLCDGHSGSPCLIQCGRHVREPWGLQVGGGSALIPPASEAETAEEVV